MAPTDALKAQPLQLHTLGLDVLLVIADALYDSAMADENGDDSGKNDRRQEIDRPFKFLPYLPDFLHLSRTCKLMRALLAPRIFKIVYVRNTVESGLSLQELANGKYAGYVKELRYVSAFREPRMETAYPPQVDAVLSTLHKFDKLERLSVGFPSWGYQPVPETTPLAKLRDTWCTTMEASLRAISRSFSPAQPGRFTVFEAWGLDIVTLSRFDSAAFCHFLPQLKKFSLSLRRRCEICYSGETESNNISNCLNRLFFNHLSCVEDHSFDANWFMINA